MLKESKDKMGNPVIYFTGVRPGDQAGHFCYPRTGPKTSWGNWFLPLLDYHPLRDRDPAWYARSRPWGKPLEETEPEGIFEHLTQEGWTMLAAWDRSADPRGGCTATFAIEGEYGPEEAHSIALGRWPDVFERIEKHLGRPVIVRKYGAQP